MQTKIRTLTKSLAEILSASLDCSDVCAIRLLSIRHASYSEEIKMIRLFASSIALISLAGCSGDPNSKPEYGDESGLPKNCRAYIQESVDDWRNGVHSTEDTMDAIERNCGVYGDLWDN